MTSAEQPTPRSDPSTSGASPATLPADSAAPHTGERGPRRVVGFWGAMGVMVGMIIGGGIFGSPPEIARLLESPGLILSLWLLGGLLCLAGGLTYSELATMFPQSGGVYVFLREGYGRVVAFVFGWTYMLITKPAGAAGVCVLFAANLNELLVRSGLLAKPWDQRLITIFTLIVLTGINVRGTRLGAGVALVLTIVKYAAVALIVVCGLALVDGSWDHFAHAPIVPAPDAAGSAGAAANAASGGASGGGGAPPVWLALAPVMAFILWTYDGWSDVGAIAGEVKNPARTLPRVYVAGVLCVIALYLAANAAYLWALPLPEQRATDDVAPALMDKVLGAGGAIAVAALIVVSTLGSTHASVMTGARVTYQQAVDGLMFARLGRLGRRDTPATSLWVQCALSCVAVWFLATFAALAGAFIFTMWIFYALAGSAIFVLRARRPDLPRPARCPGYPVVPGLFVLASLAMTVMTIRQDPEGTLPWLGVLALGVPVYYVWEWARRRGRVRAGGG